MNFSGFFFKLLKWSNGAKDLDQEYDIVICADCLFFDEGRPQLLNCLLKALKPGGSAIIVAPSRSGTFEDFVELTQSSQSFVVSAEVTQFSDPFLNVLDKLQKDSRFIPNLHSPKILRLEKSKVATTSALNTDL